MGRRNEQMETVRDIRQQKRYRIYQICKRILESIRAKVRIALSCSVREVVYTYRVVNMHGCPMISHKRSAKMKNFVVRKLRAEGFKIRELQSIASDTSWTITVSW